METLTFAVEKDLFTEEYVLTMGNMEVRFDTHEELLVFMSNEIKTQIR